ncbi:unnamed protein product [Effrenium voratum]|nr:unnamed protein product [Effrenium voratum]
MFGENCLTGHGDELYISPIQMSPAGALEIQVDHGLLAGYVVLSFDPISQAERGGAVGVGHRFSTAPARVFRLGRPGRHQGERLQYGARGVSLEHLGVVPASKVPVPRAPGLADRGWFFIITCALPLASAVPVASYQDAASEGISVPANAQTRMMRAESRHDVLLDGGVSQAVSVDSLGETDGLYGLGMLQARNGEDSDCVWDDWSDWSVCQFTCGEGVAMRFRKVQKMAQGSGKACDNKDREERDCTKAACPVDCKWKDWSDWGECSASCGDAKRYQRRTSESAQFGGRSCSGAHEHSEDCETNICPVDCQWNDWKDWGGCSKSCGGGKELRTREMTPGNSAGKSCDGERSVVRDCGAGNCPVDCALSDWGAWELCSVSCGTGATSRKRLVVKHAAYGGAECGDAAESHPCTPGDACPVDCVWSDWSEWQGCATSCGDSTKKRLRFEQIKANEQGAPCSGESEQEMSCSQPACPVDCALGEWLEWNVCSVSCGPGITERTRAITLPPQNGGKECDAQDLLYEKKYCSFPTCPVDCEWLDWTDWSVCTVSCASGTSGRSRVVKTASAYGGKDCTGDTSQQRQCDNADCPVDCVYSDWSAWMKCSVTCGTGNQERERVIRKEPKNGGKTCLGDLVDNQACTEKPCPIDCALQDWEEWSACTSSCGSGQHKRSRVKVDAQYGGEECKGNLTEVVECPSLPECPEDCVWEDWALWSDCSVSCGSGVVSRMRKRAHYESHGGHVCWGTEDDIAACELDPCPLDCILEDWAAWSGCSSSCGNGTHTRSRSLTFAAYGGKAGMLPVRPVRRLLDFRRGLQDKYRLGRQIGVGTYGFVYDVQSRRAPQMKRAAKVIGITASEEAERRLKSLQREVDLWHRVSVAAGGQGVVQLFEVFVGHGFLAAVMEHCGPSLMDCAPEISRMKAAGVAHIFREMLKPIVFLHNLRIVHRDIKPENFLFCHQIDRSEVKLCDFGLATEMPTIGLRSGRYGTLPYMSPEMVGYSGHGFPTDLWSFGASAYYLLFNEFAYGFQKNGCPQTMAASIQSGQPQPRFFSLAQQIRTTSGQQAIGLLTSLLKHKSNDRVSAREAQNLPFLTKRFRTDPQKYLAGEYRSHCCKELSTSIEL